MLPRLHRLSLKSQWPKIRKEGKTFQGDSLVLLVAPQEKAVLEKTQFGFIVSNKISKKATVRNRLKRLLRAATYKLLPQIKPGFNVVILGKSLLVGKELPEILQETGKLFLKAKLLK